MKQYIPVIENRMLELEGYSENRRENALRAVSY
jgi:hypothetical protein